MNSVLKNHELKSGILQYFVKDGNEILDLNEIVNVFNYYFVNVDPNLAVKILKVDK